MGVAALVGASSSLFLLALGLAIGLTYTPCYSSLCVEQFYPHAIRVYIGVCCATLAAALLLLLCRKYSITLKRIFSSLVFQRPIPYLNAHLSWGGVLIMLALLFLFTFGHGYLFNIEYQFYNGRAEAAVDDNTGAGQLAIIGITGHFNDLMLGLIMLPVSRDGILTRFFALEPGTLLRLHKLAAYLLCASLALHTVLYISWIPIWAMAHKAYREAFAFNNPTVSAAEARAYPYYNVCLGAGVAALLILVAIVVTSLPSQRRKNYNTFYYIHALSILFFVLVSLHASTDFYMLLPGLFLWTYDWVFRAKSLKDSITAQLQKEENGWYRIIIPGHQVPKHVSQRESETTDLPLKSYYLNIPEISRLENHPFTACNGALSTCKSGRQQDIVILWRVPSTVGRSKEKQTTEWTTKLAALFDPSEKEVSRIDLEAGDSNILHEELKQSETIVQTLPTRSIRLRMEGPYTIAHRPFEEYQSVICLIGGTGISSALSLANTYIMLKNTTAASTTQRMTIIWSIRDTEDADLVDVSDMSALAKEKGVDITFEKYITGSGRPRLDFASVLQKHTSPSESTWVYFSGPSGFMDAGEQSCIDANATRTKESKEYTYLEWYCAKWDV